jgi:hypothetical protein
MPFEQGPYLNVATFCEQVIEDKSGVLSLIRIVDRMNVSAYGPGSPNEMPPANLNWFLVLSLKSGEARGSHTLKIIPELPSGLSKEPVTLSVHFEGGTRGQNVVSRINLKLEMPGIYWFKLYLENQFLTKVPVEVIYSRTSVAPPQVRIKP